MSTVDRRTDEGTAIPRHATVFGSDRDGCEHAFSPVQQTVYVSDGREFPLEEYPISGLEGWIAHVEAAVGWCELRYQRGDPMRGLARRVAGGVDG